jgi:ACS family hexuronate transporter-like MFS transporter
MAFSQSAGWILEVSGSYWSLFAIASSAYLLALAILHVLAPALTPVQFPPEQRNSE